MSLPNLPPRGSLVEVRGLTGRTDLNGKRGLLTGLVQNERLGVELPAPVGTKALRREKLLFLRLAGERAAMPQLFPAPVLQERRERRLKILAFGDSLTAGYWDQGDRFWPYGAALTEGLLPEVVADVSVCGLSSLSAQEMNEALDEARVRDGVGRRGVGLRRALLDHGPFDLAIVMAGTNDLGQPGEAKAIFEEIKGLHRTCHRQGVPTVALSVPPSGASAELPRYRKRWEQLNGLLKDWALQNRSEEGVRLFVDTKAIVPFTPDSDLWEEDQLHLSRAGSIRLGQSLVPLLKPLLSGSAMAAGALCEGESGQRPASSLMRE